MMEAVRFATVQFKSVVQPCKRPLRSSGEDTIMKKPYSQLGARGFRPQLPSVQRGHNINISNVRIDSAPAAVLAKGVGSNTGKPLDYEALFD